MLLEFDNFAHQLSEFKSEEILWQVFESAEVVKLSNFFAFLKHFGVRRQWSYEKMPFEFLNLYST